VDRPRLYLIGYRGTGKTTVAKVLAARLGWQWLDADTELERRHSCTVRALFAAEGEAGFRSRESALLAELCRLDEHVIATGGGVILRPENRTLLAATGRTVLLTADVPTLWERLQADPSSAEQRPALTVGGVEEIVEVLKAREALYHQCAELTVSTQDRTPEQVSEDVIAGLAKLVTP
jgi:shikimate kinase